jgi:hypothetical protein
MTAVVKRPDYTDTITPILSVLDDDGSEIFSVEEDLTDEEREIISQGEELYRLYPERFVRLEDIEDGI